MAPSVKTLHFRFELYHRVVEGDYKYEDYMYNKLIVLRNKFPFLPNEILESRAKAEWFDKLKQTYSQNKRQQRPVYPRFRSRTTKNRSGISQTSTNVSKKAKKIPLSFDDDDDDIDTIRPKITPVGKRSLPVLLFEDEPIEQVRRKSSRKPLPFEDVPIQKNSNISNDISSISKDEWLKVFEKSSFTDNLSSIDSIIDITGNKSSSSSETKVSSYEDNATDDITSDSLEILDKMEKCSVSKTFIPLNHQSIYENTSMNHEEMLRKKIKKPKTLTTTIEKVVESPEKISTSAIIPLELNWNVEVENEEEYEDENEEGGNDYVNYSGNIEEESDEDDWLNPKF